MGKTQNLLFFLLAVFGSCCAQFGQSCITPDGRAGNCTSLKACPMLRDCKPQTQSATDFLQKSACGTDNAGKTAYCCETGYSPSTTSKISNPCYPEILPRMLKKLPKTCGEADSTQRIYGGERSPPKEFPWVVLLEFSSVMGPKTPCAGALISKNYVLTAAHCFHHPTIPADWEPTSVRLGEYILDTDPDIIEDSETVNITLPSAISIPIKEVIIHENYNGNSSNHESDIALLKLATPVRFSENVRPICLPGTTDEPSNFTCTGWGQTESVRASNVKQKVQLPLIPREQCREIFGDVLPQNWHLCAGGQGGKDACRGDSGGPLMALAKNIDGKTRWTVFGIVSFGVNRCGLVGSPSIFIKVSFYLDWIMSKMV